MQYQRKDSTVVAVKWDGSTEAFAEIIELYATLPVDSSNKADRVCANVWTLNTPHGVEAAEIGDYVVKDGYTGTIYKMSAVAFERAYAPVERA